jgi:hypothetical protein
MRLGRCGADEVCAGGARLGIMRGGWIGCVRLAMVGLVFGCEVWFAGVARAAVEQCPNAALRVGASASLPDCRAYELVTPANLGRTQDLVFNGKGNTAIPSSDGESIAVELLVPIEPNPETSASIIGTHAVFSRTPTGWEMKSATVLGTAADRLDMRLINPDLSQVALVSYTTLNQSDESEDLLEVGPVGGPYTPVATVANNGQTNFLGANVGTKSVPAFSYVLFSSTDHALLPPGPERKVAEETVQGAEDLYEWSGGSLRLVNVTSTGSLVNPCGATLGRGPEFNGGVGAVSADGSKIFFTANPSNECGEPSRLYMRVDGRETVEVSEPEPGVERKPVRYMDATADGSEVFFDTPGDGQLFEYDTEAPAGKRLTHIGSAEINDLNRSFVLSEDGSTIYYETETAPHIIYRYETATGKASVVATATTPRLEDEPSYTTPNGEFLLFASGSVETIGPHGREPETRGAGHNELYRYDHADGSVMCVSCGEGVAPAKGQMIEPHLGTQLETSDESPSLTPMSEDGQEVFFQTTAQLVPQDTNGSTEAEEVNSADSVGDDVYEWEVDGAKESPGVFCHVVNGCTHLITTGEDVGPSAFLGASSNGNNVFLGTAAQLVPQATPEFDNIYDARVDGGFAPSPPAPECLSCQGVGSPPPLFSPGASGPFAGADNPPVPPPPTHTTKCSKGKKLKHGRCVRVKARKKKKAKAAKSSRRGK